MCENDRYDYELRVDGDVFMTGDSTSIRVIFGCLTGRNFAGKGDRTYSDYLNDMEHTYKIRLRGRALAHGFPGEIREEGCCGTRVH